MNDLNYFGQYKCGCPWGTMDEPDDAEVERLSKITCRKCLAKLSDSDRLELFRREFFRRNSLAQVYCGKNGQPPCPEQYREIIDFSADDREVGLWSGFAAIGRSFGGKTTACYHKTKLLAEDGYDCLAITSYDLNDIPNTSKLGLKAFNKLVEPWYGAEVLLVDDLDKVNVTPTLASHLWNLFERRLRLGSDGSLLTMVTMNVTSQKAFAQLFSVNKGKANDITSTGISLYNRFAEHLKFIKFI